MKKITALLLCIAMIASVLSLASCGSSDSNDELLSKLEGTYTKDLEGTVLNVFNWGEYISDGSDDSLDINAEFEKLTGIKVNYTNYESNEQMYSKMKSGAVSYDIIIPSDYMIARLKSENMLKKLDFSKISNYKYIADEYKNVYFDEKNEYSVPYSVGMVGLIYNKEIVTEKVDSWSIMWDEKYKDNILTFNNSRDAFAIAQFLLGQDVNSTNKQDWYKAYEKLVEQNKVLQGRVMDEVFNKMENNNAAIAPYYAGDYLTMLESNENLGFVYPKEGTNIFMDSICVPSSAQNFEAAMMYINFMLDPEIALANAEYIRYASPNTAVVNNDDYSLKGNEVLYPKEEDKPKTQYFHDLDKKTRTYYETLWESVLNS